MTVDDRESYFKIETIQDGISVCFVDIPMFMACYMPDIQTGAYRRMKSVRFLPAPFLLHYFNPEELDTVNRFKVLKKQVEWMAGKAAVKKLVSEMLGQVDGHRLTVSARKSGEPYLDNYPDVCISISHSGRYAVAAVGLKRCRVAVDVEKIESGRMASIGRIAFSDRERERLNGKNDEEHYRCWTVKEAYLKIIGKGFAEGLKKVEILENDIFHHGVKVDDIVIQSSIIDGDYAFTLIYQSVH